MLELPLPDVGDTLNQLPVFEEIDQRIFLLSAFFTVTVWDGAFCPWTAVELTEVGLTESTCAETVQGSINAARTTSKTRRPTDERNFILTSRRKELLPSDLRDEMPSPEARSAVRRGLREAP